MFFILPVSVLAQTTSGLDTNRLYLYGLQADVASIMRSVDSASSLPEAEQRFKEKYERRFKSMTDTYQVAGDPVVQGLLDIYTAYWRSVLLKTMHQSEADASLSKAVDRFLKVHHRGKVTPFQTALKSFLESRGYFATTGKTGSIYDLILWKREDHHAYTVRLPDGETTVRVVFIEDIKTLGWEDYATFGKYVPGGWAKTDRLYCVRERYDLNSEKFRVSYLSHEGQHFADYKRYPKLRSADLEYRAKLTEIVLADATMIDLIGKFIANSKNDANNPHAFANFHLISRLSEKLFNETFVDSLQRWKAADPKDLKEAARLLLTQHSLELDQAGSETVTGVLKHTP